MLAVEDGNGDDDDVIISASDVGVCGCCCCCLSCAVLNKINEKAFNLVYQSVIGIKVMTYFSFDLSPVFVIKDMNHFRNEIEMK